MPKLVLLEILKAKPCQGLINNNEIIYLSCAFNKIIKVAQNYISCCYADKGGFSRFILILLQVCTHDTSTI